MARIGRALQSLIPSFVGMTAAGTAVAAVVAAGGIAAAGIATLGGIGGGGSPTPTEEAATPAYRIEGMHLLMPAPASCIAFYAPPDDADPTCPVDQFLTLLVLKQPIQCAANEQDLTVVAPEGRIWAQVDLHGCDFSEARIGPVVMDYARLTDADLRGARIDGASMIETVFVHANLSGAAIRGVLYRAEFAGANLRDAVVAGTQADTAIWQNTTCPDGTNSNDNGDTCLGTASSCSTQNGPPGRTAAPRSAIASSYPRSPARARRATCAGATSPAQSSTGSTCADATSRARTSVVRGCYTRRCRTRISRVRTWMARRWRRGPTSPARTCATRRCAWPTSAGSCSIART